MAAVLPLGQIVATPGALALGVDFRPLLLRHQLGDWGRIPPEDQQANRRAVEEGTRVLSVYPTERGVLWIITEANRSSTCVLLPEEY